MKLLLISTFLLVLSSFSHAADPDVLYLMKFKSSADQLGSLKSWKAAGDPCSGRWLGVSCARDGGRVTRLVLEGLSLAGSLEPLTHLANLRFLSLHNNSFNGNLHLLDFATWQPHMKVLHLSSNRFTGHFPSSFLRLRRLRRLDLADNLFSGTIPMEIGFSLHRLFTMRLERNIFTGKIPTSISTISDLSDFNVSYNFLSGEIPASLSHFPASSFKANPGLFAAEIITSDPAPPSPSSEKGRQDIAFAATTIAITAAAVVSMAAGFWIYRLRRDSKSHELEETQKSRGEGGNGMVVFDGCKKFEVDELMRGSAEMLGRGAAGTTYRVVMEEDTGGEGVAVKRIRRSDRGGRRKDDEAVLGEMARWRHPNVVSLRAYYATDEELLLVFDYVAGGSLYSLLHGTVYSFFAELLYCSKRKKEKKIKEN